jgi:hypothetical protein
MIISAQIISTSRSWYTVRPCAQIAFALGQNDTLAAYPQCIDYFTGVTPNLPVIVTADFASQNSMELSAALGIPFGAAGWLALLIHTFAIECYVSLTPSFQNERSHEDTNVDMKLPVEPHTKRIIPSTSTILRTTIRARNVQTRLRRPERRKIR